MAKRDSSMMLTAVRRLWGQLLDRAERRGGPVERAHQRAHVSTAREAIARDGTLIDRRGRLPDM